ncbi:MAG TPA: DUF1761 family protein [Terriglobales bacterium]|nr:DUF1761 family protein [Terriglobales bacterium]
MNIKKFFLAFVVVSVAGFALSFVIHGLLLHEDYSKLPNLLRTEQDAQGYFHFMIVANVLYSLALVWIYAQGVSDKPWFGQGVRFGLAVWLLTAVPTYLIYYAVQPWPVEVIYKSIGFDLVRITVIGVLVAAIYRK